MLINYFLNQWLKMFGEDEAGGDQLLSIRFFGCFFLFGFFVLLVFFLFLGVYQKQTLSYYKQFLIFEMNEVSQQQINCVFETDVQVLIFDQDNWCPEPQQNQSQSNKIIQVPLSPSTQQQTLNNKMLEKLDKQIKNSKQNFFRVNITKKQENKNKKNTKNVSMQSTKNVQIQKNRKRTNLKKIDVNMFEKNPNCILKQGYLEKKTDSFFWKWKTRYFALTGEKLFFFQDAKKEVVVGCVNLKIIHVQVNKVDDTIVLDFLGQTQNIILKCQNKAQSQQWINLLTQVVHYHKKQKKLLLKTSIKPLYMGHDSITQKQLNLISETGDILLFYTRNTGAKIQRVLTNSDFDHVAMIVKFHNNQAMVFQSNQAHGVSIFDWNQYIRFFNLYDKVTLRKLYSPRKQEMHHTLLSFVRKNLGKKYDLSAYKLLKLESDFDWEKVGKEQARGFFCSELIAKAFKSIGIIDPRKSSGRYWPVDFSQKGQMQLRNGAFLGAEQSVILNRHIKNAL